MGFKKPNESGLVRAVIQWLKLRSIQAWRQNSGAFAGEYNGKKRFVKFCGRNGVSDILGILPNGKFLAIECKMPGKQPTSDQRAFLAMVNANGGLGVLAYSLADVTVAVEDALTEWLARNAMPNVQETEAS